MGYNFTVTNVNYSVDVNAATEQIDVISTTTLVVVNTNGVVFNGGGGGSNYTLPAATTSTLGGVIVSSTGSLTINESGALSVDSSVQNALALVSAYNAANYLITKTGITGTSTEILDSVNNSNTRVMIYKFRIQDGTSFEAGEIWIVENGSSDLYISEFNIIENDGLLGTFTATIEDNLIKLKFTPNGATNMSIKVSAQKLV